MFPLWLTNKWTLRVAGVLAVVLLLLGARAHYIGVGKQQGEEKAKVESAQALEQMRAADREETLKVINSANEQVAEAQQKFIVSVQRESTLAAAVQSLSVQRAAASASVSRLTDSQLHGYIVGQLAIRPTGDQTPGYLPAEERKIADAVTKYPIVDQQIQKQAEQITQVKNQVEALEQKQKAMETKYTALSGYTVRLEGYYTQLYNQHLPKVGWFKKVVSFGTAKPKKLNVPSPNDLQKP